MIWKEILDEFGLGININKMRKMAEEIAKLRLERTREFNERMQIFSELQNRLAYSEQRRNRLRDALEWIDKCDNILRSNEFENQPYVTLYHQSRKQGEIAREALKADEEEPNGHPELPEDVL